MIKMIANKDFICEIMEEIIEFNEKEDAIMNYVMIVEKAINDLSIIVKIW